MVPRNCTYEVVTHGGISSKLLPSDPSSAISPSAMAAQTSQGMATKSSSALHEQTSPNSSKQQQKKSVQFNTRVRIRKTLHINNYSDDEIEEAWFSDEEFKNIRKDALFVAELIREGHEISDQHCTRGIEMYTGSREARKRQQRKTAIRWALLNEISLQSEEGNIDYDYIAKLYAKASSSCVAKAHALALEDKVNALP